MDDLTIFCAVSPGKPPKSGVTRQAVKELIERELASNPEMRRKFLSMKAQFMLASSRGLRVVK